MSIGAVILAAGLSRRMGRAKQLLPIAGKPMVVHVAEAALAAGLKPVVIVTGHLHNEIADALSPLSAALELTHNPRFHEGMGTSIAHGIDHLGERAEAALIMLADQPYLPADVIRSLTAHYRAEREKGIRMVRAAYHGIPGHPVLFDATLFPALTRLSGDEGGRSLMRQHPQQLRVIPFDNAKWGLDVDTEEEYDRLVKMNH